MRLTNLQRFLHRSILIQLIAPMELVGRTVGQARVQTNVLLVVGETPERNAQLQLLGHRRKNMFDQFEWNERRNTFRRQFSQCGHLMVCK